MRKIFLSLILILILFNAAAAQAESARLLFIGDIMAHDQQLKAAKTKNNNYNFRPQFRRVKPLFEDEFTVGNLETVFAGANKKYSGYPLFNTPDILIEDLKESLGIDFLTLANNHIFDKGEAGARRTAEVLENAEVPWTGLGLDIKDDSGEIIKSIPENDAVLINYNDLKFAFINLTYGSNLKFAMQDVKLNIISHKNIEQAVNNAKALEPDIIIACFHWGNEYQFKPSAAQQDAANYALECGADLIIGTHPHVLQPVEIRDYDTSSPKAIAWSLGNFVSFQRTLPRERSIILAVEFSKDLNNKAEPRRAARITRVSAAPLYVIAPGSFKTEVTYAGFDNKTISKLDFKNISKNNLAKLKTIGRAVLEFLGVNNLEQADEYGFYTLWDENEPENLPVAKRKSPK
ncbi:MAG: CapA family protein [Synergistaceae bacterium]|nr:CapA family protein [Synergistaceae bacterium]